MLPNVPDQVDKFETFMADSAYDGLSPYDCDEQHSPGAHVTVPPRKMELVGDIIPEPNRHVEAKEEHDRIGWQQLTGYGLRESTLN